MMQVDVGLVVGLVASAIADEKVDIAEILADDEKLGVAVAEPLLPEANHIGVKREFGAAPDLPGASLYTNSAALARSDQSFKLHRARPFPRLAQRNAPPRAPPPLTPPPVPPTSP